MTHTRGENKSRTEENMNRTVWLLAVLAMLALISGGCSNAAADTGSSDGNTKSATAPAGSDGNKSATPSNHEQAVKFAECMRDKGVKDFPDPDASGAFTIEQVANGSSLDTNSAAFKQAINACKDLEPSGFTGTKRSPEQQKASLKFAQCIRDNGVKDFPDPAPDAPLVDTNRIPSAATPGGMSILHAAMRKCRDFAAAAGVTGGQ